MNTQTVAEIAAEIRSVYDDGTFLHVEMNDSMVEVERGDVSDPENVTLEELATIILKSY